MLQYLQELEDSFPSSYFIWEISFMSWKWPFSWIWSVSCVFIIHLLNSMWEKKKKRTPHIFLCSKQSYCETWNSMESVGIPFLYTHSFLTSARNSAEELSPESFNDYNYREDGWIFLVSFFFLLVLFLFLLFPLETCSSDELLFCVGPLPGCSFKSPNSLEVKLRRE